MWEDVDQNVDQREAAEEKAELVVVTEHDEEGVEDSREALEGGVLEDNTHDPQTPERPEGFNQTQMTDRLMREKERRSAELELPENFRQLAEIVNLAAEAAGPENADLLDKRATDETVCVDAEQQTEPSEQKEQTSRSSEATLPEQLAPPRETDEPEITEQLPAESEATAEAEFSQDKRAATSRQAEDVAGCSEGSAETALAKDEQAKPTEAAVPHANGREVDGAMARRLAERLFNLDGFQRVDVVKHLDKE